MNALSDIAVLASIHPNWCKMIFSGEKTVEVRKAKTKLEPPFRLYIYCTLPDKRWQAVSGNMVINTDELFRLPDGTLKHDWSGELPLLDIPSADSPAANDPVTDNTAQPNTEQTKKEEEKKDEARLSPSADKLPDSVSASEVQTIIAALAENDIVATRADIVVLYQDVGLDRLLAYANYYRPGFC